MPAGASARRRRSTAAALPRCTAKRRTMARRPLMAARRREAARLSMAQPRRMAQRRPAPAQPRSTAVVRIAVESRVSRSAAPWRRPPWRRRGSRADGRRPARRRSAHFARAAPMAAAGLTAPTRTAAARMAVGPAAITGDADSGERARSPKAITERASGGGATPAWCSRRRACCRRDRGNSRHRRWARSRADRPHLRPCLRRRARAVKGRDRRPARRDKADRAAIGGARGPAGATR